MSEYPTHIVRDVRHRAIGASEKAILFSIADRMQSQTEWVWPALETIAADAGLSEAHCRRILKWLRIAGVVVERIGEHRGKDRRIDFERLASLPADAAGPTRVSPGAPTLSQGSPSPGAPTLSQGDHGEPPGVSPGAPEGLTVSPKGPRKDQEKEDKTRSADVPPRALASFARPLALPLDPTVGTGAVAAPSVAVPGPSDTPDESLPVPTPRSAGTPLSAPTAKAAKKPTKSKACGLSAEQSLTFRGVTDAFWREFEIAKGEKPIMNLGGRDRRVILQFLEKVQWNGPKACEIIANAFSQAYYRERFANFDELLKNTTRYQGAAPSSQSRPARMSTMQTEPGTWDRHDDLLAMEHAR